MEYCLLVNDIENGISILSTHNDLQSAKTHADNVSARKGVLSAHLIRAELLHQGDGKSFLENATHALPETRYKDISYYEQ